MTHTLRSGLAFLVSALAFGCGDSSADGKKAPNVSGGAPAGAGATGGAGNGDGDGPSSSGESNRGSGGNSTGDGDGDLSTGGSNPGSGGNDSGGAAGAAGDGDGDGATPVPCGNRAGTPTIDGFLQATDDMATAANGSAADFQTAIANIESELELGGSGGMIFRTRAATGTDCRQSAGPRQNPGKSDSGWRCPTPH